MNTDTVSYELYPYQFYCPRCLCKRPYSLKPVTVKTHFYYVPWYEDEPSELIHVVECKACKKGFDPRILRLSNQNFVKLAAFARHQILEGSSIEVLREELAHAGLQDEFADKLIMLAQS